MVSPITTHQRTRLPRCVRTRKEELVLERCRGKRVLHVGACDSPYWRERIATGSFLHTKIAAVAATCVGVDIDGAAIDDLRETHEIGGIQRCEPASIRSLGLAPFDVVAAADVIEHVSNPGEFLEDLRELIRENGELLLTTANAYCLRRFVKILFGREANHPDHVAYYSYLTLKQLLTRAGLEIAEFYGYACEAPAPRKARIIDRLSLALSAYLSDGIALIARRATS